MGSPHTSLMESGAATESTSAAAQLAKCCSIPLAEAASFLEDGELRGMGSALAIPFSQMLQLTQEQRLTLLEESSEDESETTDGSIPVCWSWAAVQLTLLLCRPLRICTSPQWLNKAQSIAGVKKNPLPKGRVSAQVLGRLLAHDPFRPFVCCCSSLSEAEMVDGACCR